MTDKMKELQILAEPLYKWLQEKYSPHHMIIIESGYVRVVSDEVGVVFEVED